MRVPSLLESLLSSKQDAVPAASLDPQHPSTSSISPLLAGLAPSSTSKTYQRLKRQCLKRRQLFVDLDFPPTNESLFLDEKSWNGANLEIEWKRPGEIVENPKLFVEGASPFDVTQGILGNCWFVSACSALTHNEALLQKVIPEGQEWAEGIDYAGIFQFCFWRFGRWVDVLIDDLLPCKDGKLLFARSKTPNEFWSALLEKAFAKLYGCYENLVGGQLADALQDVSGGVAESLKVREFLRQHQLPTNTAGNGVAIGNGQLAAASPKSAAVNRLGSMDGSKRLFYQLKHAFDREALIVAAIAAKKEDIEKSLDCGLVLGHAYAVTAIRYIELDAKVDRQTPDRGSKPLGRRQAMVRLQNPWGEKEWNGPWSDGSSEWEQVTAEQKRRLGITVDEDGEFWMPWEDFVRYFTDISVCQLLNTESVDPTLKRRMSMSNAKASRRSNATIGMPEKQHREWTFFGRWSTNGVKSGAPKDRAGGCLNFPATFCFNPQFMFDVPAERGSVEVMFALSQRDDFLRVKGQKKNKHRQPYLVIGLHLMRVERNRRHRIHQAINPVATSEFSSGRSMYLLADLAPGRYILVPSTYAPREETDFMLRIYSTLPSLNPVQLEQDLPPARASLAKCGLRVQCVTRLRILEVFFTAAAKTNADGPGAAALPEPESELFCRVAASTGQQRAKTEPQILMEPGQPVKFNESFIFFSRSASQNLFVEVLERRKPFKRRNKSLGRAQFRVLCDQNDCTLLELELKSGRKENCELAAPVAKVRVEVCSYDDPLYI